MLRHPDPPLSDGVITLRPLMRSDVDALVAICRDPAIPRWTRVPDPYTRADAEYWVATSELDLAAGRTVNWLAVDERGDIVASVGLQRIDRESASAEIGYWVAAPARGRGIAARAVRLVGDWATTELGLRRIEILTHEANAPSQGVARAAGYRPVGERWLGPDDGLPEGRYLVFSGP